MGPRHGRLSWNQLAGRTVWLEARPAAEGAKTYEIEPVRSDTALRYNRWLADNIKTIDKATGGKVGYMHVNAMNSGGIGEFEIGRAHV